MAVEKKLERIASTAGYKLEDVKKLYEELKAKMKGKSERIILNAVIAKLRKRPTLPSRQKAEIKHFIGFLIGDCGLRDRAEEMRSRAERAVSRYGLDYAIEKGLVNEKGQVLDTREMVYGRANPNYRKPIPENLHLRSHRLYLLVKEAEGKKFELAHLQTDNNALALAWCQLPFYKWVTFPALVQEHSSIGYRLTGSTAKETRTIFREVKYDADPFEVYEKFFKPQLTPIGKVEQYHEAVKDAWDRWIICYGIVGYLGLERETLFGIPALLLDPEYGVEAEHQVRFFIPEHLKINFGEYSEVYVFGRTRRSRYRDPETGNLVDGDVVIDAWGIYPNPKYTVEPSKAEIEEEEGIEGFIPLE
ncbi:MAG: hypothetical protein DRI61_03280 [Chloroflexi bacterium]|nr:MAG: hypothetical protein DRI61_03280 [Chloroflexota bacterium]